jgi:hypothetical protein
MLANDVLVLGGSRIAIYRVIFLTLKNNVHTMCVFLTWKNNVETTLKKKKDFGD